MQRIVFQNARIFDGESDTLTPGSVVVENGLIADVIHHQFQPDPEDKVIDCNGRVLMPGLIDAHVHVYATSLDIGRIVQMPLTYGAHFASRFLRSSLERGFTTLRDVGGGDVGIATAIREGLIEHSPRFIYGGRVISQTGGHGDFRPGDRNIDLEGCGHCACHSDAFSVIADGVDEVRKAVREELRRGAAHIKVMGSGGVASPTDPLERNQYSDDEIRTAVEEAERWGVYVAAHCHPASAVKRAAELGVRSIEHATLIDEETADIVARKGAFAVPTMATIFALAEDGENLGFPPVSVEKVKRIVDKALAGLEVMKKAGVKMGLGTDLLGPHHVRQCTEFTLRAQVLTPLDILRSACSVNAELMGLAGKAGTIRKGAFADLLVVNGNPLENILLLAADGANLDVIMHDGKLFRNSL